MAAGVATLRVLEEERVHPRLEQLGARLAAKVAPAAAAAGMTLVRVGSIFWLAPQADAPRAVEAVSVEGMQRYGALHARLLADGIYLAPSGWEVAFLSHAMDEADIDRLGGALAAALAAGAAD